jgi:aryl-alcohol dehydrogenase-like predicted oxidoreductase
MHHHVNYLGNNSKSLHVSLNESLKKLRTDYVDILYLHWWDYETSIPEVMNSLHNLVAQGKVLYLVSCPRPVYGAIRSSLRILQGVSDTPAWVVSQCNQWALDHGKTPFSIYQGAWNVLDRSFERDIVPMCRDHGMAIAPWNVLAGGKLRSDAEEERRRQTGEKGRDVTGSGWERTPEEKKISNVLEKVGKEVGVDSVTAVAIAYLMHKTTHVFPIVGGRKVEHLKDNIKALSITLSPSQVEEIDSVNPWDPGFPHNFIVSCLEFTHAIEVLTYNAGKWHCQQRLVLDYRPNRPCRIPLAYQACRDQCCHSVNGESGPWVARGCAELNTKTVLYHEKQCSVTLVRILDILTIF